MKDAFNGVTEVRRGPAKGENESGVQNLKSLKGLKVARIGEQSVVPISEILEAAQARGGFFFCLACVHVLGPMLFSSKSISLDVVRGQYFCRSMIGRCRPVFS